jgi:hypothetical protein
MKVIGGVILKSGEMGSRCRLHVANRDGDGSFAADETIFEGDVTRPVAIPMAQRTDTKRLKARAGDDPRVDPNGTTFA